MRFKLKHRLANTALGLAMLVFVLGHATQHWHSEALERLDQQIYDFKLQLSMPGGVDERIVIVDIDERALASIGRWPWGRDRLAQLTDKLFTQYGVKTLGIDMVFSEPDQSSGLPVLEQLASHELSRHADFLVALARLRPALDHDARFAEALKDRPTVLGYYFTQHHDAYGTLPAPSFTSAQLGKSRSRFEVYTAYGGNLTSLQRSAAGAGHFTSTIDLDGVSRRAAMLVQYQDQYFEALSLAIVRAHLGETSLEADFGTQSGSEGLIEQLRLRTPQAQWLIPVDENVTAFIPYRGAKGAFPYVSALDVLQDKVEPALLRGKIALLGTTAPGLFDQRATPVGKLFPGVEIHANLIAGMLDGTLRAKPWFVVGADFLTTLLAGLVMLLLVPWLSAMRASLLTLGLLLLLVGINVAAWQQQMVLPLAGQLVMVLGLFAMNMTWGYFVESRSKRQLTLLFGQYVPPKLVEQMSRDPENYSMAGHKEELTVLFADIRGFTTISEVIPPDALAALMNRYLGTMTEIVHQQRGTLDKYIGDAIMAFWGAPVKESQHAHLAVLTALRMLHALPALNQQLQAQGWPELKIGIGINTGAMTVGDMGSAVRQSYTVLGDAVNLASRLEGITKQYGVSVLIGEATYEQVRSDIVCCELDLVRVKGKDTPVGIYEPWCEAAELSLERASELTQWQQALAAYRAQRWDEAEALLQQLRSHSPRPLYELYANERLPYLRANPPGSDWNGVWTYSSK